MEARPPMELEDGDPERGERWERAGEGEEELL